jgi:Beta-galactosidase
MTRAWCGSKLLWLLAALLAASAAQAQGIAGLYAVGGVDRPLPPAVLANLSLDGVSIRASWRALEPSDGVYAWGTLDSAVAQAAQHGKKINLAVTPGVGTPDWVYRAGAAAFHFAWDKRWGFEPCSDVALPLPWDSVFAAKWTRFIRALGQRYAGKPAVVSVAIQGVNAQTDELLLPNQRPGERVGERLVDCPARDDVAAWQAAGYRPSRIVAAWSGFAASYARAFPRQYLVSAVGPWPMPAIDEQGAALPSGRNDTTLLPALLRAALQIAPNRLVVANNGLSAVWHMRRPDVLPPAVKLAYQTAFLVTGDATCRMNHFVRPCDAHEMLRRALLLAAAEHAAYVEIYIIDSINPALQDVLAEGQRALAER